MLCTVPKGACVAVAALMQYFLMAAFCWMLVEGIYLYLFVVKVYNINNKMTIYHVMSWGKSLRGCLPDVIARCYSLYLGTFTNSFRFLQKDSSHLKKSFLHANEQFLPGKLDYTFSKIFQIPFP